MHTRRIAAAALTLACLMLGGCRERNEPVKPIAGAVAAASAQPGSVQPDRIQPG